MGQLVFQATAGGQVALVGPNPATNFSINVPAITGTLVTTGDTGTVTSTMLASSVYTAPGTIGSVTPNTGKFTSITNTGLTAGRVLFSSTGGLEADSANLFWDNTNARLGIGTSSPSYDLDINKSSGTGIRLAATGTNTGANLIIDSTGTASSQISFVKAGTAKWAVGGSNIGTGGANDFSIYNYNLTANALTILSSNNYVGIGTVNPSYRLDLGATGNVQFFGATNGIDSNFGLIFSTNTITLSNNAGTGVMAFSTASSERMRIDSSGNVLINTTGAYANFTNYNKSAAVTSILQGGQFAGNYSFTNYSAASNNSTVDALRFLNPAGTVLSVNFVSGIFSIYVSGGSGANAYAANYALASNGNGTSSASLSLIGTANTRGTSPVASVQIAADGGGGAVKLTITYINNSGVVNGGYAWVTFNGLVS